MTLLLDTKQAHLIDQKSVNDYHIPLELLMENAGKGVAQVIIQLLKKQQFLFQDKTVLIVVGTGNNGADGLVAARHLMEQGIKCSIYCCGNWEHQSNLFAKQYDILRQLGVDIYLVETVGIEIFLKALQEACITIDAIGGTGIDGELKYAVREITRAINESHTFVVSVDIPTGLHVDTGNVSEDTIEADCTVTMVAPKVGMFLYPGQLYVGNIYTISIGAPIIEKFNFSEITVLGDKVLAKSLIPLRDINTHKGNNGHSLIIGGAQGMWGAPLLASVGAVYSGAGKTTLGLRESIYNAIMSKAIPEVMGLSILEGVDSIALKRKIQHIIQDKDAIGIGPGLGRTLDSKDLVEALLISYEGPIVLDADALYVLANHKELFSHRDIPAVLTPHVGEFSKLTELSVKKIESNRVEIARQFAMTYGVVLVLKGAPTVIAYKDGTVVVNHSGNAGMAIGGMGDVLTGVITSLIGQGLLVEEAATLGVYLHGYSADLLHDKVEFGYTPSEVAQHIGKAITAILKD